MGLGVPTQQLHEEVEPGRVLVAVRTRTEHLLAHLEKQLRLKGSIFYAISRSVRVIFA